MESGYLLQEVSRSDIILDEVQKPQTKNPSMSSFILRNPELVVKEVDPANVVEEASAENQEDNVAPPVVIDSESDKWLKAMNAEMQSMKGKILNRFKINNSKKGWIPIMVKKYLSDAQSTTTHKEKIRIGKVMYLRRTDDMFLVYGGLEDDLDVTGYLNDGFQTDGDDIKSQSGYFFVMNGGEVAWRSSKQDTIKMSSIEVEYIVVSEVIHLAYWMKEFTD
ncbi:hypothetical protein Tco_0026222 [Tanacetum coccineum]